MIQVARGIVLVAAVGLLAGCGGSHGESAHRAVDDRPAVAVSTLAIAAEEGASSLVLPARVEARAEVTLESRVSGRLTRLVKREGESFRAGETLAEFSAPEAAAAVSAARARLASAIVADERTSRQEARLDSLFARGVVSQRDLEVAQTAARAAAAERAAASADVELWASGTRLVAPFDGVVVRRMADPGADVPAGRAILALRSRATGEVAADLPESRAPGLDAARYEIAVGEGAWAPARLVRVEGMIDSGSRSRRLYMAPDPPAGPLEAGAFARVRITWPGPRETRADGRDVASQPRAILVPSRSVVRRGGLDGVFVVVDGRARLRWVRLGPAQGDRVEVAAGLGAGDVVVLDPGAVTDGRRVSPRS